MGRAEGGGGVNRVGAAGRIASMASLACLSFSKLLTRYRRGNVGRLAAVRLAAWLNEIRVILDVRVDI